MTESAPPWTFGEPPLDQTRRLADLIRRVTSLALALEADSSTVATLLASLEQAEAALAAEVPANLRPRVGEQHPADGRVYLDHASDIGAYNPAFPEYTVTIEGDHASGTIAFPLLYEGPPGLAHGGFLAVFFDSVVQQHNCALGQTGKTAALELRYSAPTPLLRELRFEVDRAVDGRRIRSTARLFDRDALCVTAEISTVAGDRSRMPPWSARRT